MTGGVEPRLRVTAVCSGNICRSPIAEVVLRDAVERAGLGHAVLVDSAGIGAWHLGQGADRRSVAVLARHGYDGSQHQVRQITRDWIDLRRLAPDTDVRLLRSFDPDADDPEVEDPYYGSSADFERVLAEVESAAPGIVAHLRTLL